MGLPSVGKYNELLVRLKLGGPVSSEEITEVANRLRLMITYSEAEKHSPLRSPGDSNAASVNIYTLLQILGWYKDVSYAPIIEQFLNPHWKGFTYEAFIVLCRRWGMTAIYLQHVLFFMRGAPWAENEMRVAAIEVAGEYLSSSADSELLRELIEIYENKDEDPYMRIRAYGALSEATGHGWVDLPWPRPCPIAESAIEELANPNIVWEAKARLLNEQV